MEQVYSGIVLGLTLSVLVGPIFFVLVQTTVERGFRAGMTFVAGVWTSDFAYAAAVYSGVSLMKTLLASPHFNFYMSLFGGSLLLIFGLATLFSPTPVQQSTQPLDSPRSPFRLWVKGFLLNAINPGTIFFWVGITSTQIVKEQLSTFDGLVFLFTLFAVIVFTDVLKVASAKLLQRYMQPRYIAWLRKISGIALIAFGIILIYKVF